MADTQLRVLISAVYDGKKAIDTIIGDVKRVKDTVAETQTKALNEAVKPQPVDVDGIKGASGAFDSLIAGAEAFRLKIAAIRAEISETRQALAGMASALQGSGVGGGGRAPTGPVSPSGGGFPGSVPSKPSLNILDSGEVNTIRDAFATVIDSAQVLKKHIEALSKEKAKVVEQAKNLNNEVGRTVHTFQQLGAAAAAAFGAFKVANFIQDSANLAARVQVLGTVLNIVGRNAGFTRAELAETERGIKAMGITTEAARQSLTQFIQAGLKAADAAKLARAAQDLAVVSGTNSSEAFQRLLVNIQQLDTVGLRFQGVLVNREVAEQKYARSLGKTAEALDLVEKRQALLNAVLEEASKLAGSYEASMDNVGKQLTSIPRLMDGLREAVGENLLPAFSALVREFSLFLENARLTVEAQNANKDTAITLARAVGVLANGIRQVLEFMIEWRQTIVAVVSVLGGLLVIRTIMALFSAALAPILALGRGIVTIFPGASAAVATLTARLGLLRVALLSIPFLGIAAGVAAALPAIARAGARLYDALFPAKRTIQQDIKDVTERIKKMNVELNDATTRKAEATASGDTVAESAAQAEIDRIKKDLKKAREEKELFEKQQKNAGKTPAQIAAEEAYDQAVANTNAQLQAQSKAVEKLNADLSDLYGKSYTLDTNTDQVFSVEAVKNIDIFKRNFDAFITDATDNNGNLVTSFTSVRQSLLSMFASLKTGADFEKFFEVSKQVSGEMKTLKPLFVELERTATFKQQKIQLEELNQTLEGYTEAAKQLSSVQSLASDLVTQKVERETAVNLIKARVQDNLSAQNAIELQQLLVRSRVIEQNYKNEIQSINSLEERKKAIAGSSGGSEVEKLQRLNNIEKTSLAERLTANKTYYDNLGKLAQDYLQKYEAASNRIKQLDQERANITRTAEQTVRELRRGTLTEVDQLKDKEAERDEQLAAARSALLNKDQEGFKAAVSRAKQLTSELAQATDPRQTKEEQSRDAVRFVEEIKNLELENNKTLRDEAVKTQELQKQGYDETIKTIKEVETRIKSLASQQLANLRVELDQTSLATAITQLEQAFSNTVIKPKIDFQINADGTLTAGNRPDQAPVLDTQVTQAVIAAFQPTTASIDQMKGSIDSLVRVLQSRPGTEGFTGVASPVPSAQTQAASADIVAQGTREGNVESNRYLDTIAKGITTLVGVTSGGGVGTTGGIRAATGGQIPGVSSTGREDNVLTWLTPEEYVQPVPAVRYYGVQFMEAIRTMKLPRYWAGGDVNVANIQNAQRYATGGPVTHNQPRNQITQIAHVQPANVMTQRSSVTLVQNALKQISNANHYATGGRVIYTPRSSVRNIAGDLYNTVTNSVNAIRNFASTLVGGDKTHNLSSIAYGDVVTNAQQYATGGMVRVSSPAAHVSNTLQTISNTVSLAREWVNSLFQAPKYALGGSVSPYNALQGGSSNRTSQYLSQVRNVLESFVGAPRYAYGGVVGDSKVVNLNSYFGGVRESLAGLRFPAMADGGLVQAVAEGGAGAQSEVPKMALDLTVNGRNIGQVVGSPDTVRSLVNALKEKSRGTRG